MGLRNPLHSSSSKNAFISLVYILAESGLPDCATSKTLQKRSLKEKPRTQRKGMMLEGLFLRSCSWIIVQDRLAC